MSTINPWINFNGNAEEAFTFYKSVFGGEFTKLIRFKDLPNLGCHVSANEADKIMQIALPIGTNVLLANDVPEGMGRVNENENRSKIAIGAETKTEAYRLFNGLSEGGAVEMPMAESPWGTYFGMFRDKYGIEWTIEFDARQNGQKVTA
jgi:PhnB protein